ncbi:hypothetical protein LCGC14_3060680 [marine sediment metagenome]|uniref:Uncharacterized protein n=1 Tax=marine sediment metagenome TaxID=412755 RepID=A0A0F8X786_9ZZZZ
MSTALAIGGIAANVIGSVFQGVQEQKAAEEEAEDLRIQAGIQRDEANEEARRLDVKNKKFLQRQSLMFLKGGVSLAGSPMLILEETREEAAKESGAVRKRGAALFELGMSKADRLVSSGRASFIGGLFNPIGSGTSGFFEAKRLGVF